MAMMLLFAFVYSVNGYCDSGNKYTGDSNLGPVSLAAIDDQSDNCDATGVQDLSSQTATLSPGQSYTLTFQATTCNSAYPRQASAYIDWNCDGDFTNDQQLFSPVQIDGTSTDPIPLSQDFVVPSSAVKGCDSRMRVIVMELPSTIAGPCGQFNYGAAKDFKIVFGKGGKAGGSGGMSAGTAILITMIVCLVLYIALGMAFGIKKQGKPANEAFPQKEFWLSFPGLVKDGVMFTKGKLMGLTGKGGSAAYDEL